MALYSGIRGACWPNPEGLLGSHEIPTPGGLFHWPVKSGYFPKSIPRAAAVDAHHAAASAMTPIRIRPGMIVLPLMDETGLLCSQYNRRRLFNLIRKSEAPQIQSFPKRVRSGKVGYKTLAPGHRQVGARGAREGLLISAANCSGRAP